ncbi:DUF4255 domain-containing protein [Sorangium sp. So ce388]|uniref:DUF4255 domain-containing protein n=1 Tax=Sorangium sp. So ce388 TaxID=3133309 RepID=UPI003F5B952F
MGFSLARYLGNAYTEARRVDTGLPVCSFQLSSSGDMHKEPPGTATMSLYLYRVTMNQYLRNSVGANDSSDAKPPLALDLHYLLTAWSDSVETEQTVLGWTLRQLYQHEALSASDLSPGAGWTTGDLVQVIPAELSNEDLMRIWDALHLPYRLSVSYIARVVRIDAEQPATARPVVARRIELSNKDGDR